MMNAALIATAITTLCAIVTAWLYIRCRAANFYRESTLCSRVYHKLLPLECCEPLLYKVTTVRPGAELDAPQAGGATGQELEQVDVLRLARDNGAPPLHILSVVVSALLLAPALICCAARYAIVASRSPSFLPSFIPPARAAKERAAGLLDAVDEADGEASGISMTMLRTWAEDKTARRVLEEWAVRCMQTWYLRTMYERQLRAWEVNQAREQFMLPEHRKARRENQEAMRQVSLFCTVTFRANPSHNLTRSP